MKNQQSAIIMFKLKDASGIELSADSRAVTPKAHELHVSFQNQAVRSMLNLELADVTIVDAALTSETEHERKFFATKNFDEDENITLSKTTASMKTIVEVLAQNFHSTRAVNIVMKSMYGATRYLEL